MTVKKKILIPINSDLYIRNYIKTDAFNTLKKKYSLFFIANKIIKNVDELNNLKNFKGYFDYKKHENVRHQRILNTLMWRYRKTSTSFAYRLKWFSQIFELKETKFKTLKYFFLKFLKVSKFRIFIQFFGSKLIFPLFRKFYMLQTKPNSTLINFIENILI